MANRTAIITGGGTGVGAAVARMLAASGCNIAINYSRSAAEAAAVHRDVDLRDRRRLAPGLRGRGVCTPDHVASAVCWLLAPDCMVTGQLIPVDAGFLLGRPPSAAGAAPR